MANIKFPLSKDAVFYYNTSDKLVGDAGTDTAQLWLDDGDTIATGIMRNLTLTLDSNFQDTNTRAAVAGGFMSETPVLKGSEVTFDTPWDMSSPFISKLLAAWNANPQTRIAVGVLNRDKTGLVTGDVLNGFVGNMYASLGKDENVDDVQRANWSIRHADNGVFYTFTQT